MSQRKAPDKVQASLDGPTSLFLGGRSLAASEFLGLRKSGNRNKYGDAI